MRPVAVGYVADKHNIDTLLSVYVSVDGQRMSIREAVALGLMFRTPSGGYEFDAKRCTELADTLIDTLTGRRQTVATHGDTTQPHHAPGLQPRLR